MAIWSVCIFVGKLSEANAKQRGVAILRQKMKLHWAILNNQFNCAYIMLKIFKKIISIFYLTHSLMQ